MKIQGAGSAPEFIDSLKSKIAEKKEKAGEGFSNSLTGMLKDVSKLQSEAEESMTNLVTGKEEDLHSVMVAMNRADLTFRYMLEIRNRLVEAYQDVIRTNV